jgi:nucleoside-diphosphate-sugar epimerase
MRAGHEVTTLGRLAPVSPPGMPSTVHLQADLGRVGGLGRVPWNDYEALIHLAAAGVKSSCRLWPECVAVNLGGTAALLESVGASGASPRLLLTRTFYEDHVDRAPELKANPYVATKAAANAFVRAWAGQYSGGVILAKVYQVYGPGDDPGNVLSYAVRKLKVREHATFGSGLGRRDWIFVDDAAAALVACLGSTGHTLAEFDVGTGLLTGLREVLNQLAELADADPSVAFTFDASRDRGDIQITDAANHFPPDWTARSSLNDGLRQLLASGG